MVPESHQNTTMACAWAPDDPAAQSASMIEDAAEDTLFDYAEDRDYDLGEGD